MSDFNITETGEWNDAHSSGEISKSLVDWLVGRRFATNSENSQHFAEERIFTGFLEKQGGWRKNWRRRLFSLFKDSLVYYDDATANEKMLGEVQLCARGPDGQVVAALVWDYARAIQEGHNTASSAILDQYAPPKERRGTNYVEHTPVRKFRGRALASRTTQVFENLGDKILGSLGRTVSDSIQPTSGDRREDLLQHYDMAGGLAALTSTQASTELALCFGVRCARSQQDLVLRAESRSEVELWVQHVSATALEAMERKVATSGGANYLSSLDRTDDLRVLVPNLLETVSSSDEARTASNSPCSKRDGTPDVHRGISAALNSSAAPARQATLPSGASTQPVPAGDAHAFFGANEIMRSERENVSAKPSLLLSQVSSGAVDSTAAVGLGFSISLKGVGDTPVFVHVRGGSAIPLETSPSVGENSEGDEVAQSLPQNSSVFEGSVDTHTVGDATGYGKTRASPKSRSMSMSYTDVGSGHLKHAGSHHYNGSGKGGHSHRRKSVLHPDSEKSLQRLQRVWPFYRSTVVTSESVRSNDAGAFSIDAKQPFAQWKATSDDALEQSEESSVGLPTPKSASSEPKSSDVSGDLLLLRQFSVLVPLEAVAHRYESLLFVVFAQTSKTEVLEKLEDHAAISFVEISTDHLCEVLQLRSLNRESLKPPMPLVVQMRMVSEFHFLTEGLLQSANEMGFVRSSDLVVKRSAESSIVDGRPQQSSSSGNAAAATMTGYNRPLGSLALGVVVVDDATKERQLGLQQLQCFSVAPIASTVFRFPALQAHSLAQQQQLWRNSSMGSIPQSDASPSDVGQPQRSVTPRQTGSRSTSIPKVKPAKVVALCELHASGFAAAVPRAFLSLLTQERFVALASDKMLVRRQRERGVKMLKRQEQKLMKVGQELDRFKTEDIDQYVTEETKHREMERGVECIKMDEKGLDSIMEVQNSYLERISIYDKMIACGNFLDIGGKRAASIKLGRERVAHRRLGSMLKERWVGEHESLDFGEDLEEEADKEAGGNADFEHDLERKVWQDERREPPTKAEFDDLQTIIDSVPTFKQHEKIFVKRSTKRKNPDLCFVPTNLMIEVMHAKNMTSGDSDQNANESYRSSGSSSRSSISSVTSGVSLRLSEPHTGDVNTFLSMTLGCPAAHFLKFKDGGLRKLLGIGHGAIGKIASQSSMATTYRLLQNPTALSTPNATEYLLAVLDELSGNRVRRCVWLNDWSPAVDCMSAITDGGNASVRDSQGHQSHHNRQKQQEQEHSQLRGSFLFAHLTSKIGYSQASTQHLNLDWRENPQQKARNSAQPSLNERPSTMIGIATMNAGSQDSPDERQGRWASALRLTQRIDAVMSQTLAVAVTQVVAVLSCAALGSVLHQRVLPRLLRVGFLVSIQSLLSTFSDEKGMIEDMTVGYEWLNSVKIRFVHRVLAKALASNELKVPTVKPPAAPPIITDGDNINPVIASSAVSNEGKQRRPSQRILRRVGQPKHVVEMTEMLQQIIPASKALDSSTASEDRKTKTVAELLFQFMGNGVQSIEDLCADSLVNDDKRLREEIRLSDAEILHFREAVRLRQQIFEEKGGDRGDTGTSGGGAVKDDSDEDFEDDDEPAPMGSSMSFPGVWIRRTRSLSRIRRVSVSEEKQESILPPGSLVVDVEVDEEIVAELRRAMRVAKIEYQRGEVSGHGNRNEVEEFGMDMDIGSGDGTWRLVTSMRLVPAIFQQGINEQQSVANKTSTLQSLQSTINRENIAGLQVYFNEYCAAAEEQETEVIKRVAKNLMEGSGRNSGANKDALRPSTSAIKLRWLETKEAREMYTEFEALQSCVYNSRGAEKNVHLINRVSNLCRLLSGTHGICCKSGKDRTSMAVTLDETRHLCNELRVVGGRKACKTIRRFGIRRKNVELNTGQQK